MATFVVILGGGIGPGWSRRAGVAGSVVAKPSGFGGVLGEWRCCLDFTPVKFRFGLELSGGSSTCGWIRQERPSPDIPLSTRDTHHKEYQPVSFCVISARNFSFSDSRLNPVLCSTLQPAGWSPQSASLLTRHFTSSQQTQLLLPVSQKWLRKTWKELYEPSFLAPSRLRFHLSDFFYLPSVVELQPKSAPSSHRDRLSPSISKRRGPLLPLPVRLLLAALSSLS